MTNILLATRILKATIVAKKTKKMTVTIILSTLIMTKRMEPTTSMIILSTNIMMRKINIISKMKAMGILKIMLALKRTTMLK